MRTLEAFHRTLLDEHFRIAGIKNWYESVDPMKRNLDTFLIHYNTKRPHQGRNMNGKTPKNVFKEGLKIIKKTEETKNKMAVTIAS